MAELYWLLVVLSVCVGGTRSTGGEISLKCTPEFCDEYVQRFPCPPLDPACSNPNISLVIPSATACNCCEQCFLFQELDEDCVKGHTGQPLPKVMCKPGTECRGGKCKKMNGPDPDFYAGYECKQGKCHCAVLRGNAPSKIFGVFLEKDIKGEKQCECAAAAYSAKELVNKMVRVPNVFVPTPRCLANGQFDPLQCFDNMCGCVNKSTGTWDSTVRKVPVSALGPNSPKCFDQERHKVGQYYTDCEKERDSLMSDISLEDMGEINILLSHTVECTPDGDSSEQSWPGAFNDFTKWRLDRHICRPRTVQFFDH